MIKNGSCTTIIDNQHSGWMVMRLHGDTQSHSYTHERYCLLCGSQQLKLFITPSSKAARPSVWIIIVQNCGKCTKTSAINCLHWSTDRVSFSCTIMSALMSCKTLHELKYETLPCPSYSPDLSMYSRLSLLLSSEPCPTHFSHQSDKT